MSEENKVNLDAPAFGAGSQTSTPETTTGASQAKELGQDDAEIVTRKIEVKEEPEESEEEQKIPYSRFKTIADQKRQAEEEALELKEKYDRLLSVREDRIEKAVEPTDEKLLNYMIKLYGDNDNTREAFKVESERLNYIKQQAREEAIIAYENVRINETRSLARNEQTIDNHLDDLQDYLGRRLTEEEQSGILEVVDEYTPKDEDGNYSGDLLPFDKAYEIYEMKNQNTAQRGKRARSTATNLTGKSTEGEPSGVEKANRDFDPRNWNSYRNRI